MDKRRNFYIKIQLFINKVNCKKVFIKLEEALANNNEANRDFVKLDQAHRKLSKENKELIKKHE